MYSSQLTIAGSLKCFEHICSGNFDKRPRGVSIDTIVVHSTHMNFKASITRLCDSDSKVSCHYLINTNGKVYRLVEDKHRAWHAGKSYWRGRRSLNNNSIGIELVDTTMRGLRLKKFPELQMHSLIVLLKGLIKQYAIPHCNILAHSDIAPDRKDDPGEHFDWQRLFKCDIGVYHHIDVRKKPNTCLVSVLTSKKCEIKAVQRLLKEFGYKIKLTGHFDMQTKEVITAFRRHFNQSALDKDYFGTTDYEILECLL